MMSDARRLAYVGAIIIATISCIAVMALLLLREQQIRERQDDLGVLARVAADRVERSVTFSERIAQMAADDPSGAGVAPLDLVHHYDSALIGVRLADAKGRTLAQSPDASAHPPADRIALDYHYGHAALAGPARMDITLSRGALEAYFAGISRRDNCAISLRDGQERLLAGQGDVPVPETARLTAREPLARGGWSVVAQCARDDALVGWKIGAIGVGVAVLLLDVSIILLILLGGRQMRAAQSRAAMSSVQARTDLLTGLPNRLAFQERIRLELARAERSGEQVAIVMVDLDGFKDINDGLGHPAGDRLLQLAAERMHNRLRRGEFLARLGGDEFAVIQADASRRHETVSLARHLREAFNQPFPLDGGEVRLGASMGAALALRDGSDMPDLLEKADLALYASKSERLGRLVFYQPAMSDAAASRAKLQTELANAIDGDEIMMHYQPILDLDADRICGCEALMRWRHPELGLVPPDRFIPILEANGWITRVGELALRRACREAMLWPAHMVVAVNLSPIQCHDPALPDLVSEILHETGLPGHRLELEITETASLDPDRGAYEILHQLRGLGVRIALDDFGTGFASLARLNNFPFDKLKIDKSFVSNLEHDDQGRAVVRTTIELGRRLGMAVTAEGVETVEQLALLRRKHCSQIQGYIVSPAMDARAIVPWLARESWRSLTGVRAA